MLVYGPLDVGYHPLWLNSGQFVSTGHNIAITISYAVLFAKEKHQMGKHTQLKCVDYEPCSGK